MYLLFRKVPTTIGERTGTDRSTRSGKGVSVLIADDVALVRDSLQEMLTHLGFSARGASNGDEALGILERERFDVLMLDLNMPGLPSLDVARRCRSRWPDLAILLTSGYDPGEDVEDAMNEMGILFVAKPYLPQDVAERILEALRAARESTSPDESGGGSVDG